MVSRLCQEIFEAICACQFAQLTGLNSGPLSVHTIRKGSRSFVSAMNLSCGQDSIALLSEWPDVQIPVIDG